MNIANFHRKFVFNDIYKSKNPCIFICNYEISTFLGASILAIIIIMLFPQIALFIPTQMR